MSSLLTTGILNQQSIILDGLALYLDAGNSTSYPGTGATWYDLSGNGRNMTLTNSPSYSTNNGGILQFNGSTQYGSITSMDYRFNNFTLMTATRYTGPVFDGRIITSYYNNSIFGNQGGRSDRYFAGEWVYLGNITNDTTWSIHAFINNQTSDLRSYYRNNFGLIVNSSLGVEGFNGLSVGRWAPFNSEYAQSEVSFILVYDRLLSTNELTYNFNYFKKRFELFGDGNLNYTLVDYSGGHPTNTVGLTNVFTVGTNVQTGIHTGKIAWGSGGQSIRWGGNVGTYPSYHTRRDNYGWKVEGFIYLPETGNYQFLIDGDDACDFFIDGQLCSYWYGGHGFGTGATGTTKYFTSGWYTFEARMEEQGGGDGIAVGWKKPSDSSYETIPPNVFSTVIY